MALLCAGHPGRQAPHAGRRGLPLRRGRLPAGDAGPAGGVVHRRGHARAPQAQPGHGHRQRAPARGAVAREPAARGAARRHPARRGRAQGPG